MLFPVFYADSSIAAVQLSFPEIPREDSTVEIGAEVLCSEGMKKTDLEAQKIRKANGTVCIVNI